MYSKTLRVDGVDIARYTHKMGPQITYTPVYGLPDEETLDGTTHTDYIGDRMGVNIPLNPLTTEERRYLVNLCRGGVKWLTLHDEETDMDITIRAKPVPVTVDPALVQSGTVSRYKLSSLAFQCLDLT
jgi:hypothetical protein